MAARWTDGVAFWISIYRRAATEPKKGKGKNPGSARLDAAPPDLVRGRNRAPVQHITSACATLDFYSMKGTHNADTSQRKDDGCKCDLFKNVFREVFSYSYHCTVLGVIQIEIRRTHWLLPALRQLEGLKYQQTRQLVPILFPGCRQQVRRVLMKWCRAAWLSPHSHLILCPRHSNLDALHFA